MNVRRTALAAAFLAALGSTAAYAAGYFPGFPIVGGSAACGGSSVAGVPGTSPVCNNTVPAGPAVITGAELVPADTALAQGVAPQTVLIPTGLLANLSGFPRNYVDNGSMNIQQRGTGIVTCGTTSVPSSAYGADRWGCAANVTSGAGRTSLVTTAALLPAGFANVNELYRTSGALTQPVCAIQEIPSDRSTALAGKPVSLSFYAAALAGLAADNNNIITATIITGTGSDEGLGTMTASPAITPAWTGIAAPLNQQQITITTTPARYTATTTLIPAAATEVGVMLCFTPTANGAGVTDGFAFTGVQLEVAPSPTAYEFHPVAYDLAQAQRYYWQWLETVSGTTVVPGMCQAQSSTVAVCNIPLHVTMRTNPTVACTFGTLKRQVAGSDTALSACAAAATTNGVSDTDSVAITATVASGDTAGFASLLMSGNSTGGGKITATADF